MKKQVMITAVMMILVFLSTQAVAGSSSRRRFEGFLIGTGATILGAAVIGMLNENDRHHKHIAKKPQKRYYKKHRFHNQRPRSFHIPPPSVYDESRVPAYAGYYGRPPAIDHGQENQKIWIAPVHKQVWVPGYYNKRAQWVEGYQKMVIVEEGYWKNTY